MSPTIPPFHLAFPVADLPSTRSFYLDKLGCAEARTAERWIDFDFFGHQLSAHVVERDGAPLPTNDVDDHRIPIPHFGLVLPWEAWHALKARLVEAQATFVVEPYLRFEGKVGEQATMFVADPSGNVLEFKSFKDMSQLFAT